METITYRLGFSCEPLPTDIINKITGVSYHQNKNIKLSDLSYLKVKYYNFDGKSCDGELIVSKKLSEDVLQIFSELYDNKYQIEKIQLVDDFDADDDKSMTANNSSAFNYRVIANTNTISLHGQGRAIDINPLYNPYIVGDLVMPSASEPYANRSVDFPHKIDRSDLCYVIFKNHGWLWGGSWKNSKDYQHFYKPDSRIRKIINRIKRI